LWLEPRVRPPWRDASTEIYFVVMTGSFTCGPACFNVSRNTPTKGTALSIVVDMSTMTLRAVSLTNQPIRLDQPGAIHHLDLSQESAGNGRGTASGLYGGESRRGRAR